MSDKRVSDMSDDEIRALAGADSPADELRAAAKLMREQASAAAPGPWSAVSALYGGDAFAAVLPEGATAEDPDTWLVATGKRPPGSSSSLADALHIAGMHPGVALAVADWLEAEAGSYEVARIESAHFDKALAVARAYLGAPAGETSD